MRYAVQRRRTLGPLVMFMLLLGAGMTLGPSSAQQADEHVHIQGFAYNPDPVQVAVGERVQWHNHDSSVHTATATNGDWDTGLLSQGESETLSFDEPGTWSYFCEVHPSITGTLQVVVPNTPPTVTVDHPANGATVGGIVTIAGSADDPDGTVDQVQVRIDGGAWQSASGTDTWSLVWDSTQQVNGATLIEARSFDGEDRSSVASVEPIVDNPEIVDLEIRPSGIESTSAHPTDLYIPKQVRVSVENAGNTGSGAFTLELEYVYDGDLHPIGETMIGNVPAFGSSSVTITWNTQGKIGDFPVTATADRDGETGDTEPDNNEATRTISVVVSGIDGIDLSEPLP